MIETTDLLLTTEEIADGLIVHLSGEIDLRNAAALREELAEIQRHDPPRLIIDMSGVVHIDSSIVATLVGAVQIARRGAGIVVLTNLSERVRSVFQLTRLDIGAFTIVATTDDAISLDNRRKFGRYLKHGLQCDRGTVLDVAAGGIRLLAKRRFRHSLQVRLWNQEGEIRVDANVCWTKRLGFRRHEIGLRFVHMCTEDAKTLSVILEAACEASLRSRPQRS